MNWEGGGGGGGEEGRGINYLSTIWKCYLSPSEKKFCSTLHKKNCIHHTYIAEMPTSEDLKSGDSLFLTTPAPHPGISTDQPPPASDKLTQPPMGMT